MRFKKIILWGHALHRHTHSYVHYGFYKAFKHLGYEVHWYPGFDSTQMDYKDALFITEGSQDANIPLEKSATYILHNCDAAKYINAGCKIFFIQTHTKATLPPEDSSTQRLNGWTLFKKFADVNCLFMTWATDLLPHEIDVENHIMKLPEKKYLIWIGTYGGGDSEFQNGTELKPYFDFCELHGIEIRRIDPWATPVSPEENLRLVKESYLAPALQGPWQIRNSYIPCRIFKNISYGHFGITNNPAVNGVFDWSLICDRDIPTLFNKSIDKWNDPNLLEDTKRLMHEVRTKHTYLNRIEDIFSVL